jgi:hypothetical protein
MLLGKLGQSTEVGEDIKTAHPLLEARCLTGCGAVFL